MYNRGVGVFGMLSKQKLDELQKREDYKKCYDLYSESDLDCNNPEIREIKLVFYKILSSYLIYNPEIQDNISFNLETEPYISVFSSILPSDFNYENKICAVLSVFFYAIKNRGYNYVFIDNASHEEVSDCEQLRAYLEINSEKIIARNLKIRKIFAALMTLLYDKILLAKIELIHSGEDVISGITTYNFGGSVSFSDVNYKNTTTTQKINALKLMGLEEYRDEYIQRRNYWVNQVDVLEIKQSKNLFLFGIYNLNELNKFLVQFDFKLFNVATKYYRNFLCDGDIYGVSNFFRIFYSITGNDKKLKEFNKKHRDWPFSLKLKSCLTAMLTSCVIAIPLCGLMYPIFKETGMGISLVISILCGFNPFFYRTIEKKKRTKFSLGL